jgi:hypothetical protein
LEYRIIVPGILESALAKRIGSMWEIPVQTRMIKIGARLVRHARRLVFQLAEVLVTREMLTGMLERIDRLRLAPG